MHLALHLAKDNSVIHESVNGIIQRNLYTYNIVKSIKTPLEKFRTYELFDNFLSMSGFNLSNEKPVKKKSNRRSEAVNEVLSVEIRTVRFALDLITERPLPTNSLAKSDLESE